MSDQAVLLLALGIFLAVALLIGGIASFIFWYHGRPRRNPRSTLGRVAQIPTTQI